MIDCFALNAKEKNEGEADRRVAMEFGQIYLQVVYVKCMCVSIASDTLVCNVTFLFLFGTDSHYPNFSEANKKKQN